jgi:hypothetical protein
MDMGEIDSLRERVEAARREYAAVPREGWGELGPLDERTGERWDRGNVLGHVAELLPFWTGQIRAVLGGASEEIGRDAVGTAQRRMGIDAGREAGEDGLLERIDAGMAGVLALLDDLREADLDRAVTYRPLGREPEAATLRSQLEDLLVGHVEEHLQQVRALPGS